MKCLSEARACQLLYCLTRQHRPYHLTARFLLIKECFSQYVARVILLDILSFGPFRVSQITMLIICLANEII